MLDFVRPEVLLETAGPDSFEPAHPKPANSRPGMVAGILGARRNLIAVWTKRDYRSKVQSFKLLGRHIVIANSPDSVKYVMATRHENFERKSPQMRRALEHLLGDGLFISDGAVWKSRRPLVSDIMHKNRVPFFGPTMEAVTAEMAERWAAKPAGAVSDILVEMAELTAEIISRAVFGNDLGSSAANEVIEGFTSYQSGIDSTNLAYFLGLDEGMRLFRSKRMKNAVGRVHGVIDRVVAAHIAGEGGDGRSMIDLLVKRQKKSPELGLDVAALRNEAATIFMAGHETTAATLTWAWYLLAHAPWAERALIEEIDRVCGDRDPTVDDVPKLDYARAVIEETLRLYPPVPILSRQNREADRIGDVDVPAASLVLVMPWLLHRSPDLWDEPHHFKPERFLNGNRPIPYSYVPFAIGPRICAGLAFGLTESILCLAMLARRFRVVPLPSHTVAPVCRLTLRPRGGMPATIEARPGR